VGIVVWLWKIATTVVAIRQALDFDLGKAIATAVIAWAIVFAVIMAMMAVVFGTALAVGAVAG